MPPAPSDDDRARAAWLAALKAGDRVVVTDAGAPATAAVVEAVRPRVVVLRRLPGGRYSRKTGVAIGNPAVRIVPATPALVAQAEAAFAARWKAICVNQEAVGRRATKIITELDRLITGAAEEE